LRNDILDRAVSGAITATICPQSPLVSKRFRRRVAQQAIGDDDESVSSQFAFSKIKRKAIYVIN
jgi:hypothetical protein